MTSDGLELPVRGTRPEPLVLPAAARAGLGVTGGARYWPLPADPWQRRVRAVRDGLIVAGWLGTVFVFLVIVPAGQSLGYDAFSYWTVDLAALYERTVDSNYTLGAFRYTPPIALLLAPLGMLPWWVFLWLYSAVMLATLVWLGGRWTLALLALPPVALELYHGNIHLLMAAAVAFGFRHPWTWSFVLLTKVTPGVGLVWFVARREWRALAIALGATAAVAAVSFVVAPTLWGEWLAATSSNLDEPQPYSVPPPLPVRLPLAVALVWWGARTDRPWTVPVAAVLALPIVWVHGLVVALAALPFLRGRDVRGRDYAPILAVAFGIGIAAMVAFGEPLERVLVDASAALMFWLP